MVAFQKRCPVMRGEINIIYKEWCTEMGQILQHQWNIPDLSRGVPLYFKLWPWNYKVKVMGVSKGQGHGCVQRENTKSLGWLNYWEVNSECCRLHTPSRAVISEAHRSFVVIWPGSVSITAIAKIFSRQIFIFLPYFWSVLKTDNTCSLAFGCLHENTVFLLFHEKDISHGCVQL